MTVRRLGAWPLRWVLLALAAAALGAGLAASQEPTKRAEQPAAAGGQAFPPVTGGQTFLPVTDSPLEDFDDFQGYPTQQALRDLLALVPGQRAEIGRASKWDRPICRFSGLLRLNRPWPAGSAWQFSILDPDRLQVHVWSGAQGVTVRYYPDFHQTWALYTTTREGSSPRPAKYILAATASDLYRRTGWGGVQLQHQGGRLVLTRGDLILASAPLAGQPTEVFLEGGGLVRGLAMVPSPWLPGGGGWRVAGGGERGRQGEGEQGRRGEDIAAMPTSPLPPFSSSPLLPLSPRATHHAPPATRSWDGKLPDRIELKRLPDGRVTLAAADKTPQAQAAVAIENPGFAEFSFEVEDPAPGTGVFLGDAQGRQLCRLGFFRHRDTGQVTFELMSPGSSEAGKSYDIQRQVVPFAARRQWYRIVAGAGMFVCWSSDDGVHWSQPGPTSIDSEGACGQVGLYCLAGQKPRSITLCSLEVRRLEALHAVAGDGWRGKAESGKRKAESGDLASTSAFGFPLSAFPHLAKLPSLEKWEAEVARSVPAGVPVDVWWRACAVKTLGDGPRSTLAQPLFDRLRRAVFASAVDADSCLRFAEEASMFYTQGEWAAMDRLTAQLGPLEMALVRTRHPAPFTALNRSMLSWPLWPYRRLPVYPDDLLRHELTSRLGEGRWGEVQDLCRRLAYFNHTGGPREGEQPPWSPHAEYLVHWAEAVAAQHLPARRGAGDGGRAGGMPMLVVGMGNGRRGARGPLLESPTREGFSTMSELRAALQIESYRDAAQAITSATAFERMGLLPDESDPWLSTSFPVAVAALLGERPALAKAIQEAAASVGQLRLRQATGSGNPVAVEAVACQFPGTDVAAAAYRWLGDRELATGRFVEASAWYRQSYSGASPADRESLIARARLLGALRGRDEGHAPQGPVQFGSTQYSPAEFEQMIAQLRQTRVTHHPPPATRHLPPFPPGRFEARPWAHVEGCGEKRPPGYPDRDVDWAGRQTAVLVTGSQMIVSNHVEQIAFDLASGHQQWANRVAVEEGKEWGSLPMQPVAGKRDWGLGAGGQGLGAREEGFRIQSSGGAEASNGASSLAPSPQPPAPSVVYCRRLTDDGPELTCVDADDGRVLWQAGLDGAAASDPLWVGERLFVLSAAADPGSKITLGLVGLDATTGRVRSRAPLVEFRDVWRGQLPCQAAVADERIVAAVGGCVLCCDTTGRVHWVRRQVWIPPMSSEYWNGREWIDQAFSPPLVEEGWVFATQPGVWAIECMALDSGRLRWRQALGGLVRLLGSTQGRLVAETTDGLVGLDSESGRLLWSLEVRDRLETLLCGPQGPVLTIYRDPATRRPSPATFRMEWIDPQTGRRLGRSTLKLPSGTDLKSVLQSSPPPSSPAESWLKPVIAAEGRVWGFWASLKEPAQRDIVELIRVGEPEEGPEGR